MYTKTVTFTKHSNKGKEFTCTRTMLVMDDVEKTLRARERAERRHEELVRHHMIERHEACHHSSMRSIREAYMDYMESI